MAEGFPGPLVPAEVDLRDFQYMELDVRVLRDSKFAAEVHPEAFRAGVLLWCAAWHQVPAASLPDNDVELSALAGFGRVIKEWKRYREEALALFVRCSDGRLYHRVIAEKAVSAWNSKLRHHYDRARDRLRKANKAREIAKLPPLPEFTFDQWNERRIAAANPMEKAEAAEGIPTSTHQQAAGIPPENVLKGNGEGTERERNGEGDLKISVPDGTGGKPPPPPELADGDPVPLTAKQAAELTRKELWSVGKSLLEEQGMAKAQCGTFVGKLVKDHDEAVVIELLREAVVQRPADVASWLVAACRLRKAGGRTGPMTAQAQAQASLEKGLRLQVALEAAGGAAARASEHQPAQELAA